MSAKNYKITKGQGTKNSKNKFRDNVQKIQVDDLE
jgi:hypothetical protein